MLIRTVTLIYSFADDYKSVMCFMNPVFKKLCASALKRRNVLAAFTEQNKCCIYSCSIVGSANSCGVMSNQLHDLEVLHKCADYIAVNKHFDIKINMNDKTDEITVDKQLCHAFPELVDPKMVFGFRFAHRLDYATSGVLCVALSRKSGAALHKAFSKGQAVKHYLALVHGHVGKENLLIDVAIGQDSSVQDFNKMCTANVRACSNPRPAKTLLVCLEHGFYNGRPASKVLLKPITGRTHQLRVHCAHIGHLVIGDYTYSNRTDTEPFRMMLHSLRLVVPLKKRCLDIVSGDPFVSNVDPKWHTSRVINTYSRTSQCVDVSTLKHVTMDV